MKMTGIAWNLKTHSSRPVSMSEKAAERAVYDGVCPAADGCRVEPDGECEHGWPSKLRALGLI